mmetsp:Transcript_39279/g.116875  ORF Transcript_39279/g.116875 Transcript_39279/m.116875 type:complete len:386 (+) Transcript_39279:1391-2548(+)
MAAAKPGAPCQRTRNETPTRRRRPASKTRRLHREPASTPRARGSVPPPQGTAAPRAAAATTARRAAARPQRDATPSSKDNRAGMPPAARAHSVRPSNTLICNAGWHTQEGIVPHSSRPRSLATSAVVSASQPRSCSSTSAACATAGSTGTAHAESRRDGHAPMSCTSRLPLSQPATRSRSRSRRPGGRPHANASASSSTPALRKSGWAGVSTGPSDERLTRTSAPAPSSAVRSATATCSRTRRLPGSATTAGVRTSISGTSRVGVGGASGAGMTSNPPPWAGRMKRWRGMAPPNCTLTAVPLGGITLLSCIALSRAGRRSSSATLPGSGLLPGSSSVPCIAMQPADTLSWSNDARSPLPCTSPEKERCISAAMRTRSRCVASWDT